jgi:Domain of unknown function (DUF4864)
MTDHPRRRLLQWTLSICLAPAAARAAVLAERDARAVRSVIEAQLAAFAADDAERAYSHASTAIRTQFADAATFMAMVRTGYPMVVRPASVAFFEPRSADGVILQSVQLRDRAGRLWRATYQLVQQAGDAWRINGCEVVADSGKSLT